MLFTVALYLSLAIFLVGITYRIARWFWSVVGLGSTGISFSSRLANGFKGSFSTVLGKNIGRFFKSMVVDLLIPLRLFKDGSGRLVWIFHMLLFFGLAGLLVMHALDDLLADWLFSNYQPTLSPYLFLRDFFGILVLLGLSLAVIRRVFFENHQIKTRVKDLFAIILIAMIVFSGFSLQSVKIGSYSIFQEMLAEYAPTETEKELRSLEAFWITEYSLDSPTNAENFGKETIAAGASLNEQYCVSCHADPHTAFLSMRINKAMGSIALVLDQTNAKDVLYFLHFGLCLLGLIYLPFGKLFHIFSTPISLMIAAGSPREKESAENVPTRQMIELDGCSHGGSCHSECPVRVQRGVRIQEKPQFTPAMELLDKLDYESLGSRKIIK